MMKKWLIILTLPLIISCSSTKAISEKEAEERRLRYKKRQQALAIGSAVALAITYGIFITDNN